MASTRKRILTYGSWIFAQNIGDQLFKVAFQHLFPEFDFIFTDYFKLDELKCADAVFIGGGSFLFAEMKGEQNFLPLLKEKPIYYLGVGIETALHDQHRELIQRAQLIAPRNAGRLEEIQQLNNNILIIPDLVYALWQRASLSHKKYDRSILFLPNLEVVPRWSDPHWKHISFDYFKSEMAQFLDQLIFEDYNIIFASMCSNNDCNDIGCAIEIINKLTKRDYTKIEKLPLLFEDLISFISTFEMVITQRYHGIVLAELAQVPCLSIWHHDKLQNINTGYAIPYYGINKATLYKEWKKAKDISFTDINQDSFRELKTKVLSTIG